MALRLTPGDEAALQGELGPGVRMAMTILARMAEVYGATELMDITGAHIDSTIYVGDAGLEFAEKLAGFGAQVVVPSTLNVSGLDELHWREWNVPTEWAAKAHRQMKAYQSMGTIPTWTCAPYQTEHAPKFGQQIAWGESNAIVFANSVIGARTERYPDLLDICAAITGRVPAVGLHLTENRAGQCVLPLQNVPLRLQEADDFYPVLGYLMGKLARDRIPVIDRLDAPASEDQLKALGAAAASSGNVALFHIVGQTPEAATLETALQGRAPLEVIPIDLAQLRDARSELVTATGVALDLVVLGSPHFSLPELNKLAALVGGRTKHPSVELIVTTSRAVRDLARSVGSLDVVEAFGARIMVDTCVLAMPSLPESVRVLMTNSGKYAYYSPGLLGTEVVYGSLEDCVRSAVKGEVTRDERLWAG